MKKKIAFAGILAMMLAGTVFALPKAFETEMQQSEHTPRLFGSTYMTRNNPFFDVLHESLGEVVEENGDILITRDPLQDQEKQNEQIYEMLEEGIELLFLNPVDWEEVQPAVDACKRAGVPIINIDTRIKDQSAVVTCIETDNYQAGQECAKDMVKRLEKARIVILNNPTQTSISDRVRGFKDIIEGNEQYEVIYEESSSGELEVAAEVVANFLKEHPDAEFDVLLGGNDPSALGGLSSLQQYKRDEGVLVYGIDGSPDFKAMLELGYVTGTSSQSPKELGRMSGEVAYEWLAGKEVAPYVSLPSRLITKDNLNEYEINGWQ
ncbi:MAG: sugar ABC transporter substrate-binding protein [Eubacteriales bacterium]|nr:sugar ABC transporter substrate-binding protein [Eubacteriales bacterium]